MAPNLQWFLNNTPPRACKVIQMRMGQQTLIKPRESTSNVCSVRTWDLGPQNTKHGWMGRPMTAAVVRRIAGERITPVHGADLKARTHTPHSRSAVLCCARDGSRLVDILERSGPAEPEPSVI